MVETLKSHQATWLMDYGLIPFVNQNGRYLCSVFYNLPARTIALSHGVLPLVTCDRSLPI